MPQFHLPLDYLVFKPLAVLFNLHEVSLVVA
jgi:hypothetical protein